MYEYSYTASSHGCILLILKGVAPRHGFEPRFTAPKAAVLPLDDRGRWRRLLHLSLPSGSDPRNDSAKIGPEAILGRCWARASNPLCGTLCRRWVRPPLASAIACPLLPFVNFHTKRRLGSRIFASSMRYPENKQLSRIDSDGFLRSRRERPAAKNGALQTLLCRLCSPSSPTSVQFEGSTTC